MSSKENESALEKMKSEKESETNGNKTDPELMETDEQVTAGDADIEMHKSAIKKETATRKDCASPDDDDVSTVLAPETTEYDADSEMHKDEIEGRKKRTAATDDDDVSTVLAPKTISGAAPETKTRQSLKWNLRVLLSNMYMKSEQRLPSARVPKCLHNTALCVSKHRNSMLPDAPGISVAQELRNNLYNQHYDTYLDMLITMSVQSVYPDEEVFDRLFDMIMVSETFPTVFLLKRELPLFSSDPHHQIHDNG